MRLLSVLCCLWCGCICDEFAGEDVKRDFEVIVGVLYRVDLIVDIYVDR